MTTDDKSAPKMTVNRDQNRDLIVRVERVGRTPLPTYATEGAVGLDLHADWAVPRLLSGGDRCVVPTGIALEIPRGFEGQVRPRSGLARRGIIAVLGTIDADYRGEIGVILINAGHAAYEIHPGDRIAQLVIVPVPRVHLIEVSELSETARDVGGFGSTGR